MILLYALNTADSTPASRADYASLSDQSLMELLLEGTPDDTKRQYQDASGSYNNVCEWEGVECDAYHRVVAFSPQNISGTINLSVLPQKCAKVNISSTSAHGALESKFLPRSLEKLSLVKNVFAGSVDLTRLPQGLNECHLQKNKFSGSCDFTALPPHICELELQDNYFAGSVDLGSLPSALTMLDLSGNLFSGEICLEFLPSRMAFLGIVRNNFSGTFQMLNIPDETDRTVISAQMNRFSGTAIVGDLFYGQNIHLENNSIEAVVDATGEIHVDEDMMLRPRDVPLDPSIITFGVWGE